MSTRQPEFTPPQQDSGVPFLCEESSTSPLMEDINYDAINVEGSSTDDEGNNRNDGGNNGNGENGNNDNQNENDNGNAYQRKGRKRTSTVWNEFKEVVTKEGIKKMKCIYCVQLFVIPPTGATTQFHRHLTRCTQRQLAKKKQKMLSVEKNEDDSVTTVSNFKYDYAKVRELASHMILYHEYPFLQMEHVLFNKFMRANTPNWKKITRTTAKNDCRATYEIEKKKLKTLLKSVNRVNITTDMWKSGNQKIGYMVVTGHFIDSEWRLQKRVLNFFNVPPPHSGVIIADALQKCFIEWGIEDKVSTITVDNAKYNDTAVRILKDNFSLKKKLAFAGKIFHARCCAHIINLMVQDGIKEIGDIVDIVREAVKYLNASEARLIQFSGIAKQLQLSSKKLILDCPTRWNSTYLMLAAALKFREVFPRYQDRDPGFSYVPSLEDWIKVEHLCQFLGLFHVVTNLISGSEYPTANLFLP
uniref:BED-type domain-containing protein n=1 Tax=Davidia involucrata TaxID=16924 RepID=A0A5B7AIU7_DAVIN